MFMTKKRKSEKLCPSNLQPGLRSASKQRESGSTSPKARRRKNGGSAKGHSKNGSKAGANRAASRSLPSKISSPGNQSGKRDSAPASEIPPVNRDIYAGWNGLPPEDTLTRETPSPAPEVETAEWLATQGWERLSWVFESTREPSGDYREGEIVSDPHGGLWLVTDWHGQSGIPHRAERRRITREAACARVARASIPETFQGDFRECTSPRLRIETAIQQVRAFLLLLADTAARLGLEGLEGDKGLALQAGIVSLSHSLGDELAAAFYAAEDAA
jgi:hypothetical protein